MVGRSISWCQILPGISHLDGRSSQGHARCAIFTCASIHAINKSQLHCTSSERRWRFSSESPRGPTSTCRFNCSNSLTATCTSSHQLRHYDVPADDNYDGIFSFLLPIIADESRIGTQIFFRRKDSLNSASKDYDSHWHITLKRLINALLSQLGAFLKKTARQLQVETLQEDTIRV